MQVIITNLAWIRLEDLDQIALHILRNDLTIVPKSTSRFNPTPDPIRLYAMTDKFIGVPRAYYLRKKSQLGAFRNAQEDWRVSEGIPLSCLSPITCLTLRPDDQVPSVDAMVQGLCSQYYGCLEAYTGCGKCWKIGTRILMFDGSIKNIEDIVIGDEVMGPDSRPRTVLRLFRGQDEMYEVIPNKGNSFTCTGDHKLVLVATNHNFQTRECRPGEIVEVSVNDWFGLVSWKKHLLKLFGVAVDFPSQEVPIDPYIVGVWLGDGHSISNQVTTSDSEIIEYMKNWGGENGFRVTEKKYKDRNCSRVDVFDNNYINTGKLGITHRFSLLRQMCKTEDGSKFIPQCYLINSKEVRLNLLAGLLDTDGYLSSSSYEIVTKYDTLRDGIVYLAQSLGFYVSACEKIGTIKSLDFSGKYYRINIGGPGIKEIPMRVERKKAHPVGIFNYRRSGFRIEKRGVQDYYGIECSGDSRHLLWDFTVVHNSVMGAEIVRQLGKNTLFLMHRNSLIDQWKRNIERYKPNWSIGEIKAGVSDYKGKDIVFSTFQSLMGEHGDQYPEEIWSYFGTICVDELHVCGAEKFGSVAPRFAAKYMFGLSGTIRRLDKCEPCFEAVLGSVLHKTDEKYRVNAKIFARNTNCDFRTANDLDKVQLVSLLSSSVKRNTLIANDAFKAFKSGRHPVVMAERKEILERVSFIVSELAKKENISLVQDFYIGGKSENELIRASEANIIYATMQMMKEGIDIPRLDTLLLVTPTSDPEQMIGRVCRRVDGKKEPMVVDYVDCAIPKFRGSFLNRYKMYKKLGWEVLGLERLEL